MEKWMEEDLRDGPKDNKARVTFTLFDTEKATAREIYDFLIARTNEDEKAQDEGSDGTSEGNKT